MQGLDLGLHGNPPYLRLIQQVRQAMWLGLLTDGDQLPTVKDVVAKSAINPNTVLKALSGARTRVLSQRPGVGTFVIRTLAGELDKLVIKPDGSMDIFMETPGDAWCFS